MTTALKCIIRSMTMDSKMSLECKDIKLGRIEDFHKCHKMSHN